MTYSDDFKRGNAGPVYMALHDGHKIYLEDPKPEDFDPRRTAYSLARESRYAGAYGQYTVAQHSVLVLECVKQLAAVHPRDFDIPRATSYQDTKRLMFAALHHEDAESVTGDMPQPVKMLCPDFKRLEKRLEAAVCERYSIDIGHEIVKEADRIVLCAEVRCLIPPRAQHLYGPYGDPNYRLDMQPNWKDLEIWSPDRAEKTYLYHHYELEALLK